MANLIRNDKSSVTGRNLDKIFQETGIKTLKASTCEIRKALAPSDPPENEMWRIPLLEKYLNQRSQMELEVQDTKNIETLIESLCST